MTLTDTFAHCAIAAQGSDPCSIVRLFEVLTPVQAYQPTRDAGGSQLTAISHVGAVLHDAAFLQLERETHPFEMSAAALTASASLLAELLRVEHRALVGGTEFACDVVRHCVAAGGDAAIAGAPRRARLL